MKTSKKFSKLLQSWQVNPPRNPNFHAEVWARIHKLTHRKPRLK
jgi:hypothetical protein